MRSGGGEIGEIFKTCVIGFGCFVIVVIVVFLLFINVIVLEKLSFFCSCVLCEVCGELKPRKNKLCLELLLSIRWDLYKFLYI